MRATIDDGRWRAALLADLDRHAQLTPGRRVTSIFFGGGTPSLMPPATAAALIERIGAHWRVDDDIEITLEANPTSLEAGRLAAIRDAGVNRLSLGVQSLDDDALHFLGRGHSAQEALDAIAAASRLFERYSFDLIYALPDQTVAEWTHELDRALQLCGGHLSVYQLTIEPGTAFHARHRRGELPLPTNARVAALFEATQERLEATGLPGYEISNHARPGQACRHNLTYWRYGDYIGIGPGAHGRLTVATETGTAIHATRQHRAPEPWLSAIERHGDATRECTALEPDTVRDELVMMGLRLRHGIDRDTFKDRVGESLEDTLRESRVDALVQAGFLILDGRGMRATAAGRQRLDSLLAHLLAD